MDSTTARLLGLAVAVLLLAALTALALAQTRRRAGSHRRVSATAEVVDITAVEDRGRHRRGRAPLS